MGNDAQGSSLGTAADESPFAFIDGTLHEVTVDVRGDPYSISN